MKKKHIITSVLSLALLFSSCGKYLDKYPDNRMELHTPEDAAKFLVSAYPDAHAAYLLEMYSDNSDEHDYTSWSAISPSKSRPIAGAISPRSASRRPLSSSGTHTILRSPVCNEVLKHVAGVSNKDAYASQVAEAKLCRAYSMFQLANVFCQAYAPETAASDYGLPYPTEPEEHPGRTLIIEARLKRSTSTSSKTSPRACRISIQRTMVSRSTTSLHRLLMPSLHASTSMPVSMPRLLSTLMPLWARTHAPTYVTGPRGASRGSQAMYSLTPISSLLSRRISSCRR